jgi:hypothetical protein
MGLTPAVRGSGAGGGEPAGWCACARARLIINRQPKDPSGLRIS